MNIWEIPTQYLFIAIFAWILSSVIFIWKSEFIGAAILAMFFFLQVMLDLFLAGRHIPNGQIILIFFAPLLVIAYFFRHKTRVRISDLSLFFILAAIILQSITWNALPFWQNKSQVLPLLFAVMIYLSVQGISEMKTLIAVYALFVAISSIVAGLQHAGYDNFYMPTQLAQMDAGGFRRGVGLANHFVQTGMYCATIMPIAAMGIVGSSSRTKQLLWIMAGLLSVAGLAFSVVRAGLVGGALGVIVSLYIWNKKRAIPFILVMTFIIAIVIIVLPVLQDAAVGLYQHTTTVDDSARVRPKLLQLGLETWIRSPIFGEGPMSLARKYGPGDAHNTYVNMLADYGVLGLLMLLIILIFAFFRLKSALRQNPHERPFIAGLIGGLTSISIVGVVHTLHYLEVFWLIPALAFAAGRIKWKKNTNEYEVNAIRASAR